MLSGVWVESIIEGLLYEFSVINVRTDVVIDTLPDMLFDVIIDFLPDVRVELLIEKDEKVLLAAITAL